MASPTRCTAEYTLKFPALRTPQPRSPWGRPGMRWEVIDVRVPLSVNDPLHFVEMSQLTFLHARFAAAVLGYWYTTWETRP